MKKKTRAELEIAYDDVVAQLKKVRNTLGIDPDEKGIVNAINDLVDDARDAREELILAKRHSDAMTEKAYIAQAMATRNKEAARVFEKEHERLIREVLRRSRVRASYDPIFAKVIKHYYKIGPDFSAHFLHNVGGNAFEIARELGMKEKQFEEGPVLAT